MQKKTKQLTYALSCIVAWLTLTASANSLACDPLTEMETIYCDLKSRGLRSLPSLSDFRKNSIKIQRLLLKKPAARYGITLPIALTEDKKPANVQKELQTESTQNEPESKDIEENKLASFPKTDSVDWDEEADNSIDAPFTAPGTQYFRQCTFEKNEIRCADTIWKRAFNKPKHKLKADALSEENVLQLSSGITASTEPMSDIDYLQHTYPQYIEAMLNLGLADNTLSFTRFYSIFKHLDFERETFERRFFEMYEYLKTDRKTLAVRKESKKFFQGGASQCMQYPAYTEFVTCDDIVANWVFTRQ